jgi:DNA-directed RNA polymerase
MLNESKTRLTRLTELWICYDQLKIVTNNFTRDAMRLNCINVEELDFYSRSNHDDNDDHSIKTQSKDFHIYFLLLKL